MCEKRKEEERIGKKEKEKNRRRGERIAEKREKRGGQGMFTIFIYSLMTSI